MTKLKVHNETNNNVTVYITLGAVQGCIQDVSKIIVIGDTRITKLFDLMGTFPLIPGQTVELAAPGGEGFNGNFSFDTPPLNCATPDWPEGVCLAEFILNNGFQPGGQETIDISGVCGANAYLEYRLTANDWNDGTNFGLKLIKNSTRYDNLNRSGVYPYGCDNCTASVSPPDCVGVQLNVNALPICNVQRSAANNEGGTVTVVITGFTPVPC